MNKVKKNFHKEVYSKKILQIAARAYKEIVLIDVSEEGPYFVCAFTQCKYEPSLVIDEFCNYLIEAANARGIHADY